MLKQKTPSSKLVFVHIPKTGGTTLDQVLNREAEGNSFWLDGGPRNAMERLRQMAPAEAGKYDLYAGHLPVGLHEVIPSMCEYVTFLRNPVDRMISHYYHVHGEPDHPSFKDIVEGGMSLHEFVSSNLTLEIDNLQTRFVAGLEANDRTPMNGCTDELFDIAMHNLDTLFVAVGVQEYFDESLLLFCDLLGWKKPPVYVPQRVNGTRPRSEEISEDTRRAILDRNHLDQRLHQRVSERIREKIAAHGQAFQDRLEQFRAERDAWAREKLKAATTA